MAAEQLAATCGVCGAAPGAWCRTSGGNRSPKLHAGRGAAGTATEDGQTQLDREAYLVHHLNDLARLRGVAERQRNLSAVASFTKQAAEVRDALDEERERLAAIEAQQAEATRLADLSTQQLVELLRPQLLEWPNMLLEQAIEAYEVRNRVVASFGPAEAQDDE